MVRTFKTEGSSPLYVQVADVMRERIARRAWAVGTIIPSLGTLADEFDVALVTVRQAILILRREGLLEPLRGKGTFVRDRPPVHPRVPIATSLADLAEVYRSNRPKLKLLAEGQEVPRLEPDDGSLAPAYHFIRRAHLTERQANSVISIYLDERVFALARARFRRELVIPVLLDLQKDRIAKATQTLTIGTAGPEAARILGISAHAPVAEIRRIFCAYDGTVIYVGELTYRGDFIKLEMDLLS